MRSRGGGGSFCSKLSAESTIGEELEGVVSCAVHVSIDSQSTVATLERLGVDFSSEVATLYGYTVRPVRVLHP